MNMMIKRTMIAAAFTTAAALPLGSQASDGTITFTGAVTASTCTLSVNGVVNAGTATVALPTVDTAALAGGLATSTAAGTFFSIGVSNCTAANDLGAAAPIGAAPAHVEIYCEAGPTVDQATGGLINTTGAGYSNVEVKLYNASGSVAPSGHADHARHTHQSTDRPNYSEWWHGVVLCRLLDLGCGRCGSDGGCCHHAGHLLPDLYLIPSARDCGCAVPWPELHNPEYREVWIA